MASMTQIPLFPTYDSLEAVYQEAKAQLPITTENQLVTILQIQQNTIIKLLTKQRD